MATEPHVPIIISDKAHGLPFSKGLLAQSFMGTGLPPSTAYSIAQSIQVRFKGWLPASTRLARGRKFYMAGAEISRRDGEA